MDGIETPKITQVKENPPIPIKTYRWEDLKRARRRGGYPWTYLYKPPFDEEPDPDPFKLETRSWYEMEERKSEVGSEAATIQDVDAPMESPDDSADVSVSQYLDKEEDEAPGTSKRAKSEEPGRKRKHSVESSYSRVSKYSLTKSGIMKRLKEAKEKIKLPKFSFSKSDSRLAAPTPAEEVTTVKVEKPKKIEGPLYIHIPLKPPAGETDEFSYLEFEEPKENGKRPSPIKEEATAETPESPIEKVKGVQLIILSAPSDDEILDDVHIPETPSEPDIDLKKMDQLKSIARTVADKYSPETRRRLQKQGEIIIDEEEDDKKVEAKIEPEVKVKEDVLKVQEADVKVKEAEVKVEEAEVKVKEPEVKVKEAEVKIKEGEVKVEEEIKVEDPEKKEVKKKKVIKKVKKVKSKEDKLIDSQKTDDDKIEEKKAQKDDAKKDEAEPVVKTETKEVKMTVDEEDGLKTETVIAQIIAEDVKESDKKEDKVEEKVEEKEKEEDTKESEKSILKKKVSFKRRSKDDGIYEDVQVTSEKVEDQAQSKSGDEVAPTVIVKSAKERSLEEFLKKLSKATDHEYEPVNPPAESTQLTQIITKPAPEHEPQAEGSKKESKPTTPVTDSDIEFLAAKAADFELKTTASALKAEAEEQTKEPTDSAGKKFQHAVKNQASKLTRQASILGEKASSQAKEIHTRVKSIKRPKLHMPQTNMPKFEKPHMPKFEKPKMPKLPDKMRNIHMPERMKNLHMPERMKNIHMPEKMKNLHMPTFTLPKKGKKRSAQRRQTSTESTVGDSKKNIFDFKTYPRMFSRKKKDDEIHTPRTGTDITPTSERSTLPSFFGKRWKKGKFSEVQPQETPAAETSLMSKESERSDARDSVRIPLHSEDSMDKESLDLRNQEAREEPETSRYNNDVELDDAYMKENQEIHRASSYNAKLNDRWSHGTFHENLPAEYEKQQQQTTNLDIEPVPPPKKKTDKLHAGSSGDIPRRGVLEEINSDEFFLRQKGISQDNIEVGAYLSSEIREAFRQPNNALSQMQYQQDLEISDLSLPEAPKRRPLKKPKRKKTPHVSQEALPHQDSIEQEPEEYPKYYNEDFDKQQEEIEKPQRPQRRRRDRSQDTNPDFEDQPLPREGFLSHEISDENILSYENDLRTYENEQMRGKEQPGIIVSDPYQEAFFHANFSDTPSAPPRKHRSLKSLNLSEHDSITEELHGYKDIHDQNIESYRFEHEYQIPTPEEPPKRPTRTRSRTRSHSRTNTQTEEDLSRRTESIPSYDDEQVSSQNIFDYVGYSTIDKNKQKEQPQAPRRRRSLRSNKSEDKFFTVPRRLNDEQPVRPTRNYSTLGPSRPPRKRSVPNLTDEEKENVNGSPYIEIEDDDHGKFLHSGEVIQKMKDRPLPAPPRPPRKTGRSSREPLRDISQERNIISEAEFTKSEIDEMEASVQTEPLAHDFECEEFTQEKDDVVITPTADKKSRPITEFDHEETITHGALIVQPFSGEEPEDKPPIQVFSKSTERIITVRREVGAEDETTVIPEEFKRLKDPPPQPQIIERIIERPVPMHLDSTAEVELMKAHKLQVSDLDVERLTVNELQASKIKVAEIDSSSINVSEINSNSGNLVVSGIELPASFFQQLVEKLQATAEQIRPPKVQQESKATDPMSRQTSQDVVTPKKHKEDREEPTTSRKLPEEDVDLKLIEDRIESILTESIPEDSDDLIIELRYSPELYIDDSELTLEDLRLVEEIRRRHYEGGAQIEEITSPERLRELEEFDVEERRLLEQEELELQMLEQEEARVREVVLEEEAQVREVVPEQEVAHVREVEERVPEQEELEDESGKKKTSFEERLEILESIETEIELVLDPPQRPPRTKTVPQPQEEEEEVVEEPIRFDVVKVDETAPPLPPLPSTPKRESPPKQEPPPPSPPKSSSPPPASHPKSSSPPPPIPPESSSPPPPIPPKEELEIPIDEDYPEVPKRKESQQATPPPRPPQPHSIDPGYLPSQPPASFYALRSPPAFKDFDIDDDIPMAPRRRRHHHKMPVQSVTSSDDTPLVSRRRVRTPEPSIPQLTGQLARACVYSADRSLKRLIQQITNKVLGNADGKQDVNVVVVILLVLIACLILLGWGDGRQVHHHHWEYFNPPRDV